MREYTIIAILSIFVTVFLDILLKTKILLRPIFYLFLVAIVFFKFLVNGFLTGKQIVIYNPEYFLGIRIGSIPIEDFLFGFSMVTMAIIFWEYFKAKEGR
ncbi:MAG: lycopene cyclase domain-containing protein [Candidatus Omnitrophica bacterium]|nr:lycopene cyclase domain-containing protein [Candidatus Omnitrophota bacterium]